MTRSRCNRNKVARYAAPPTTISDTKRRSGECPSGAFHLSRITAIAITSVLHTDEHSHLEPVRYAKGSGFFRLLMSPHVPGESAPVRLIRVLAALGYEVRVQVSPAARLQARPAEPPTEAAA